MCGGARAGQADTRPARRAPGIGEERVAQEAGVPATPLRVEDPNLCSTPRRPEPVPADEHFGALPDDIPAEADPRSTGQLQPKRCRRGDGGRQLLPESRWLEDDEQHAGPPGKGGEALEAIGQAGRTFRRTVVPGVARCRHIAPGVAPRRWVPGRGAAGPSVVRQVDDEDIHRPTREERPGHRDPFIRRRGLHDDEPFQTDPPGHRLDRIQAPRKVHPGGNRAASLGLGNEPQCQGRPAARGFSAQRDRRIAGHPTRPEDRIQGGKAGPDHPVRASRPLPRSRQAAREGIRQPGECRVRVRFRGNGERADHPRSCRSPTRPKGCESSRDVRGKARHGQMIIEQMFCIVKIINLLAPRATPGTSRPQEQAPPERES